MNPYQPVRGTHDLLEDDARCHHFIIDTARTLASLYGYGEIATPIVEFTDVFARTLGETSDVVSKEMYTFEDKSGERITLRPENTAGIARAWLSNGLQHKAPGRFFYHGPMFRYERPQKGRRRQFHQIGIELLGMAEPFGDAEAIAAGAHILEALGVKESITLELNSLGDNESRDTYRDALSTYLERYRNDLSDDSKERLERNPLRILDSKNDGDKRIIADAPLMRHTLNPSSRAFFDTVCETLNLLGIAYHINDHLVRGLDYYSHTAFEFTTTALGAQSAVLAGGRYDGLIRQMGGPPTPGIGWAAGVERLAMLCADPPAATAPVAVIPLDEPHATDALLLANTLRRQGIAADMAATGNPKKRFKRADKIGAVMAILVGAEEAAIGEYLVRHMQTGEQHLIATDQLASFLSAG